ncbi:MAG: SnoaL-like domain-containing protein [Mycobacteriaceae bacterium]|nr:SnoaL-like domain-containing protein [Mycobacteriaceae bacterium]
MLDSTTEAVEELLRLARSDFLSRQPSRDNRETPPPGSHLENAIVSKFVSAYEAADVESLTALFTEDVVLSMPSLPFEAAGRAAVARFCTALFGSGRRYDLVPTRANGQPAFGVYARASSGVRHGTGLVVVSLNGDSICAITRFDRFVLPRFGLPRSLPPDWNAGK